MDRDAPRRDHGASRDAGVSAGGDRPAGLSSGEPVRAFVALNFPEALRSRLWGATEHLHAKFPFKWVRAENIHLSLKFLGEVDETREPELRDALRRAAGTRSEPRSLALQITGFGAFPDYHRPRVLWAGVTPDPGLELLQHAVEQAFAPLGFPTEARAFRPHVTLARAARDARPRDLVGLEGALEGIAFDTTATVAEIDLMQSTLQQGGAVYQVKHHERLS